MGCLLFEWIALSKMYCTLLRTEILSRSLDTLGTTKSIGIVKDSSIYLTEMDVAIYLHIHPSCKSV